MTTPASTPDATLSSTYFGGPRDGFTTRDFPPELSGKKLTGAVSRISLSQPA